MPKPAWKAVVILMLIVVVAGPLVSGCVKKPLPTATPAPVPAIPARPANVSGGILIGAEYAMPGMASKFAETGIPAIKYYPGLIAWSKMQKSPDSPIDYGPTDRYVKEYQDAGFTDLMIAFNTAGSWAVRGPQDYSPKPEYMDDYGAWVQGVVERYDADGTADMPGLKYPVRYYEAGEEFSTYQPEPVDHYLATLEQAYRSAHNASADVVVMNSAFLTTNAFKDRPGSGEYEKAFGQVDKRIMYHSLADIRKVLDRPDIFDAVDIHSIGDPYEIEDMVNWLNYEMGQRNYSKPIILGDTATTPFIAWGPATEYDKPANQLGIIVAPATEADRPRLAAYFQKVVDGDPDTIQWTHAFAASDVVKKVVVAADMGIALINTAYMEDLFWLKFKIVKAGAGNSAWAGMADTTANVFTEERTIKGLRPAFYALRQITGHLEGYRTIDRVPSDPDVRLYRIEKDNNTIWIAWLDPGTVVLPGEPVPEKRVRVSMGGTTARVERVIDREGQTAPDISEVPVSGGEIEVLLTPAPTYISRG